MDAFLESILENSRMAKRDARSPWKTFYEAPRVLRYVLSTPCTLASKGAADYLRNVWEPPYMCVNLLGLLDTSRNFQGWNGFVLSFWVRGKRPVRLVVVRQESM